MKPAAFVRAAAHGRLFGGGILTGLILTGIILCAGAVAVMVSAQSLPFEPIHESGGSVTGAFEGWFKNDDGTFSLLLGYFNRNEKQEVDIPIGPDNRIEPGGPDQGQPTHFLAGRQWGMFVVKVPADFGKNKVTWTIVANGKNTVIPASLHVDYEISPFAEASIGNAPPVLRFEEKGPTGQGPIAMTVSRTAKVGTPMPLPVWVADDMKLTTSSGAPPRNMTAPVTMRWSKYRGPGTVTFSNDRPEIQKTAGGSSNLPFNGTAATMATFGAPGDYMLHVTLNDYSGEGGQGFQCCWTTGHVKVAVSP
jgi:hypothetical protein